MARQVAGACVALLAVVTAAADGLAQGKQADSPQPGTITVQGRGQLVAPPDRAVILMGAVAQSDRADLAQNQVNQILSRAVGTIAATGIPAARMQTTGISLSPVYSGEAPSPVRGAPAVVVQQPRIVGYRASNTLRIQLDNLRLLGQVIDEAVAAGANQLEDLSFQLKDDAPYRQEALSLAAAEARNKAQIIAAALGVQILGVRQVEEAAVNVIRPQLEYRQITATDQAVAATPVQPGEIRVEAVVNVTYLTSSRPAEAIPAPATQP